MAGIKALFTGRLGANSFVFGAYPKKKENKRLGPNTRASPRISDRAGSHGLKDRLKLLIK
jgi:hypothetical protein